MAKRTAVRSSIRASFADARRAIADSAEIDDPPWHVAREGVRAGEWDGAPFDRLPPSCPAMPLGVAGKVTFYMDALSQFLSFDGMKPADLVRLFRTTPNFQYWAWPRKKWYKEIDHDAPETDSGPPVKMKFTVNGVEEKKAIMCLEKAAALCGPFDPSNRLRGRGAWTDEYGNLIWHSGEYLWKVENGKLDVSRPGPVSSQPDLRDAMFYFRSGAIMTPWPEPVPPAASPARELFVMLKSWHWQRPLLDPVIVLGGIGVMFLSGALKVRPHIGIMGDFGTGKTSLLNLIHAVVGDVLVRTEDTTEAGVRQHMGMDALPVALDEFEASEDNSRVTKLITLARIAFSGGRMTRGGSDHKGVEFTSRNTFFCSGINLPPMGSADLSRFAILNTRKLTIKGAEPKADKDWGRQILRALMDVWPAFPAMLADWRGVLGDAGLSGRGADTYGTLFAVAQLMLGAADMEDIGIPVTEAQRLGAMVAQATEEERALQGENWRYCLDHLLSAPIEAIKGGTRPTIGAVTEALEQPYAHASGYDSSEAEAKVAMAGCKLIKEAAADLPAGQVRWLLLVPPEGPLLERMFEGTKWQQGVWYAALRQGPPAIVRPQTRVAKINRASKRCLQIDLREYDKQMESV